ncbi:Tetrathionate reductase subunit B precursor [Caulifigura coniformis]|uniref:Tetrathionate reductase subunit B n=1 Tax=Caulifigura coniformis TaxID=2527983 RepID=A0A517SGC4_9PLAN|nr:4Fe-4S dicluster domain-containing protein [Caulifigura coniformis]QDT55160.1 Tetrathionate reductase subunit B precursor [Caulifigura coniformis]
MSNPNPQTPTLDRWRTLTDIHPELPIIDPPVNHQFDLIKLRAGFDRRHFLEVMGASMALAGATGCRPQPTETIVPYSKLPEQIVPGRPLYFATTFSDCGRTLGLLVESHEGRPTKVEGNPAHPASLGATDAVSQASILSLYDPDRSQGVKRIDEISTWEAFLADLRDALRAQSGRQGAGLRILTEAVVSPTLGRQVKELVAQFPAAKWHQYQPGHADGAFQAQQKAFGRNVTVIPRFDRAEVVVSLDGDFLGGMDGSVANTRHFMSRRDVSAGQKALNRLYLAETSVSTTGTIADHRLPVSPGGLVSVVQLLASLSGVAGMEGVKPVGLSEQSIGWVGAVAEDLKAHRGTSLVIAGDSAPWQAHLAAYLLNDLLGNVGKTVEYIDPVEVEPADHGASIADLYGDMTAGKVEVLLIVGANPVYTAPADFDFKLALKNVKRLVAQLSPYEDETSPYCHWHLPQTHFLESWSDARAFDGTASIVQPLIAPLFDGISAHQFLSAATGKTVVTAYDAVRETWKSLGGEGGFEGAWRQSVHDGVIADTASTAIAVTPKVSPEDLVALQTASAAATGTYEVKFALDPTILDGRFANNGWLQELPKPWTRLTWDNAALISPQMAKELGGVREGDRIELKLKDRSVVAPAWPTPGHPDGVVTLHFGYGRQAGGKLASKFGFNAYALRSRDSMSVATGVTVDVKGGREKLACTQTHHSIEGRDIVRTLTLDDLTKGGTGAPPHFHDLGEKPPSLYPDWEYNDRKWGMVIDLSRCVGCNACVLACQSENNIPVVGKSGVLMGREMHWLRIDRYFSGAEDNPQVLQQPMLCQHCEHAPCETVCPVEATTHSPEGLNEMTYNRCVGTRYCSNNCPYKVRRFNFLNYVDNTPLHELSANPDVTVRTRGVMEKCTYCVQRISAVRIEASKESAITGQPQKVADGSVVTACQAACAAQAIAFGDLNDKESRVAKWAALPHNYGVLAELGTRPRTTYLARVTNPNSALAKPAEQTHAGGSGTAAALS